MGEYKRTNRTKKTKILRCFPHCCPDHLNRSYCGSSLCVRVELVDPARLQPQQTETTTVSISNPSSLLVYAHFEAAHINFLAINDVIDYDDVTSGIQTEQTPKGTWIEGAVVRDAATDHSSLFQINPGARWYYEWESAATKAQRFTKHALRVYTFQRVQSQLRVVALVSSSEFMVVSYRRAPSEVRAEREALEALRVAVTSQHEVRQDTHEHSSDRIEAAFERKMPVSSVRQVTGREEVLWQNRKLWECRQPDTMTASKQLAILYHFLHHLNAASYGTSLEHLSVLFGDQIAHYHSVKSSVGGDGDMKNTEPPFVPPLSWAFLAPLRQGRVDENLNDRAESEEGESDHLSRLVKVCTSLAGWLVLDSDNLEIYRRFLRSYSGALLDKNRVRAGYVEVVKLVGKLVDRFTGWNEEPSATTSTSLSLLSEEIMTVVFKYEQLKPLRRVLMDILSSSTLFGMHEFVAQLRAQFILQQSYSVSNRQLLAWREGTQASAFDGSWVFNGHQSLLTPIRSSAVTDVSLGSLLTFMRELARMTIRPVDGESLEICSDWNVCSVATGTTKTSTSDQSGMTLVLDGRQRMFSTFPSGISTLVSLGDYSYGDYRGNLVSPHIFVVEMISWPLRDRRVHPPLRWKLQIEVEGMNQTGSSKSLVVKAIVEQGFWKVDDSPDQDIQVMPFSLKHETVDAWYPAYEIVGVYNPME